mmetsp:Transcript_26354/g.76837  ORF Transcript_26354/g.76837 Transcript_26354/m.76837 type:complete len:204 (+) Transcript_26354:874-1485(+)
MKPSGSQHGSAAMPRPRPYIKALNDIGTLAAVHPPANGKERPRGLVGSNREGMTGHSKWRRRYPLVSGNALKHFTCLKICIEAAASQDVDLALQGAGPMAPPILQEHGCSAPFQVLQGQPLHGLQSPPALAPTNDEEARRGEILFEAITRCHGDLKRRKMGLWRLAGPRPRGVLGRTPLPPLPLRFRLLGRLCPVHASSTRIP